MLASQFFSIIFGTSSFSSFNGVDKENKNNKHEIPGLMDSLDLLLKILPTFVKD
jgi:hypothetical protein